MTTITKVKKENKSEEKVPVDIVKHFSKFKKARMVRIDGNFMGGGFRISQNKIKAILENIDVLSQFAHGDFDNQIDELQEDEILEIGL